jgi:hypothetical protein
VDRLMAEIAGKEPLNTKKKRHGAYSMIEETVSEWWGLDGEILDQELQEYIGDLNELFIKPANGQRKFLPAWKLVRKYARPLTERVSLWISGSNQHTVRKCLRQWEAICRNESLGYLPDDEERMLIELTTLLTYHVVDGVHDLSSN